MARPLNITITESREELERRLQHETEARQQERLQMLYWLKRDLVNSRQTIAQLLNRNDSTISRWLNDYREGGLRQLLEIQTAPGAARVIPPEVMERLKARLAEPTGFPSYKAIWQWLRQECQVDVEYKTVHRIVRYELNAKLKVPRPRHHQQAPEAVEQFKKTAPSPRGLTRVRWRGHPVALLLSGRKPMGIIDAERTGDYAGGCQA